MQMYLEDFLNYLTHVRRYSSNTSQAYERDLDAFSTYLNNTYNKDTLQATHLEIRSWVIENLEGGAKVASVKRQLSALRSYYKFLIREEILAETPMAKVISPKGEKRIPLFVKEKDIAELFSKNLFSVDYSGLRDQAIMNLLYQTGMRVSELVNLKQTDISQNLLSLRVVGKREKERIIPISVELLNELNVLKELSEKCFSPERSLEIILNDKGNKTDRKFVYNKVKYYLSQVSSLKKRSPHVLRHTFATHMLKNGADLNAIKEILGHSSLAATQVYAHSTLEHLKQTHSRAHPRNK